LFEPYVIHILDQLLHRFADNSAEVHEATSEAGTILLFFSSSSSSSSSSYSDPPDRLWGWHSRSQRALSWDS
jgi:hypothetical protein